MLIPPHDTKRLSGNKGENACVAGKAMISTVLKHKETIKSANIANGEKETMITDNWRGRKT